MNLVVKVGTAAVLLATVAVTWTMTPTSAVNAENSKQTANEKRSFEAAIKSSTTTDIKEKMLNAIDNYQDVQGDVSYRNVIYQEDIAFTVRQGNNPSSYLKQTSPADHSVIYESYSDGDQTTEYDHLQHVQRLHNIMKIDLPKEKHGAKERAYKNNAQENVYLHRIDPADAMFKADILFPQDYAFYMDDFLNNYRIIGHETLLNRDVTVVKGTLPSGIAQKHKAVNFKFWVDSQTGILLKEIETDAQDQVINSVIVNDITINKGVNLRKSMLEIPSDVQIQTLAASDQAK